MKSTDFSLSSAISRPLAGTFFIASFTAMADEPNPLEFQLGKDTKVKVELYDRIRGEAMDWFGNLKVKGKVVDRSHDYGFMGNKFQLAARLTYSEWLEVLTQFQDSTLAGIPSKAVGLGARYYENSQYNDQNSGFLRQGWMKLKYSGSWLSGGRQLYADGAQGAAQNRSLKWIQDTRLSQRLIGSFDYTHVGRSFDGGTLGYGAKDWEISAFGFVPTQGGFDVHAMDSISGINLSGITLNLKEGELFGNTLGRLAFYNYNDHRENVVALDNKTTLPPQKNTNISINTIGGHLARLTGLGSGQLDTTVFAFGQMGTFQGMNQRAWAYGAEMGYQLPDLWASPWLRAGVNSGSGDTNRQDRNTHGTFFQMLPTAWLYAQFPFYNLMNNQDVFVQAILRPDPKVNIRWDYHSLSVNSTEDLVYSSSGAGNQKLFGYLGTPTHGFGDLANLTHVSVSYQPIGNVTLTAFYAHAFGQQILSSNYTSDQGDYGFFETTVSF